MRKNLVIAGVVAGILTAAAAAPVQAQTIVSRPSVINVTPYGGYMLFGDFARGPAGTKLSNKNGPVFGAQLGIDLSPSISLIGNVARATSDVQVGIPFLSDVSVGDNRLWLYDAGLQLSLPAGMGSTLPISPFVQLGAGAVQYDIDVGPASVTQTNFAFNAGVGTDIPFSPNIGLRLAAKDYIQRFKSDELDAVGETVRLDGRTTHNWALTAGLRVGF